MQNYSFNSTVLLKLSVVSGPLGQRMDGIEMAGVEMGSILDDCCMCLWRAKFNSREKGEGGVKPLEEIFRGELFTSTSKHLRLQWRGQELVLNVISVDCWWRRRRPTSCGCRRVLCLWWKALQNALHLLLHFIRPVDEVALQLASLLHDPLLPFPEPC